MTTRTTDDIKAILSSLEEAVATLRAERDAAQAKAAEYERELDRRWAQRLADLREYASLRAQVAALAPEPWIWALDELPPLGEIVLAASAAPEPFSVLPYTFTRTDESGTCFHLGWWRRIPPAVMAPPPQGPPDTWESIGQRPVKPSKG